MNARPDPDAFAALNFRALTRYAAEIIDIEYNKPLVY